MYRAWIDDMRFFFDNTLAKSREYLDFKENMNFNILYCSLTSFMSMYIFNEAYQVFRLTQGGTVLK